MNVFTRVTRRTLQKNRIRTLVTIVGILLSAAMFTAVTTSIVSLQDYLQRCAKYTSGDWHGSFNEMPAGDMEQLRSDDLVETSFFAQNVGYAKKEQPDTFAAPYYYVMGCDETFLENMPIHLTEGRLPENGEELVLRDGELRQDGTRYRPGDTLTLELGERMWEGETLWQNNPYCYADENAGEETLWVRETRTYTVVGLMERPDFEDYSAPGSVAVTFWDDSRPTETVKGCFRLTDPKVTFEFVQGEPIDGVSHYCPKQSSAYTNSSLLAYEGASRYDTFYEALYSLGAILMGLIVFGSVSLIYNAFSISVSERTRQFGLLSSVGATRRQIRRMVLTEALMVGVVGIPLGILAGLLGMGVTFHFIGGRFYSLVGIQGIRLRLVVRPEAVLIAAAVAFVTVLISAWVPARRAMGVPAMEAIRQSGDLTIRRRQVKTGRLTYRIFGLEGMLARKHFRRNRRRYRATVVSLFMSVVLFISASSFCAYLTDAVRGTFERHDYDISYDIYEGQADENVDPMDPDAAFQLFSGAKTITQSSHILYYGSSIELPEEALSPELLAMLANGSPGSWSSSCYLFGVYETTYRAYLREQGLSEKEFLDTDAPKAVVLAGQQYFDEEKGRTERLPLLHDAVQELTIFYQDRDLYQDYLETHTDERVDRDALDRFCGKTITVAVGAQVDRLPFGLNRSEYSGVYVVLPMDYLEQTMNASFSHALYFKTTNHKEAMEELETLARDNGLDEHGLFDAYAISENDRNMVVVVKVFAYGFITLISLIAVANVFNTVSTNLLLRRRELAMLRSVGMTRRGFRRMLAFECLLYGAKALLWGLPAAVAVTYLIYRSTGIVYETSFYLPWGPVAVAVGGVFAVVFASMLYSWSKLRRDNPIDALRSENI